MFSVMWSEHCSYKSSRPLLRTLPTAGEDVVAGPGENAGVISIGDGLAVAFKIESHNHPSAVEPYQGAATGVGGILRDIFTMGARPIAVLDALRFGDPASARTRHLVDGVVRGVGGYGNCVGVPTVGGELVFDPSYEGNPLVNVMAIGLLEERLLTRAAAPGPGNLVVLFGSTTGRDGIGGASVLASATFGDDEPSKRPSVQVGDPFAEKLLIEASLELIERGLVEGLQDLGAAGITCATSETADRAGTGMRIDLDAIPRREPGMEPFEVMISESQERMLAIVRPDRWDAVREVCERWGLPVAVIGRVTDDGDIAVVDGRAQELARRARPRRPHERRDRPRAGRRAAARAAAPRPAPGAPADDEPGLLPERGMDPGAVLLALLGSANLSARRAGLRAVRLDGPGEHGRRARPRRRGAADQGHDEGARRDDRRQPGRRAHGSVARRGDERRRGDPQRLDHRRAAARRHELPQLRRPDPARRRSGSSRRPSAASATRAARSACRSPAATSRSTTSRRRARSRRRRRSASSGCSTTSDALVGPAFRAEGDAVVLVGEAAPGLAGSEYARLAGVAPEDGPPALDLAREAALQAFVREAAERGLLASAQDVVGRRPGRRARRVRDLGRGDRGLGARLRLGVANSPAVDLFGESPSRVVVSARPRHAPGARPARPPARPRRPRSSAPSAATRLVIELAGAGATGAAEERGSRVADALDVAVADLRHAWEHGLSRALGWDGQLRCAASSGRCCRRAAGAEAAAVAALGLFALQHRGQESAGVAVSDGEQLMLYKDLGMISPVLDERRIPSLRGDLAIAHCRYSTTGSTVWENAQPTFRLGPRRAVAIGHNGNLVNTRELLASLRGGRGRLPATTDTELLTALLADEPAADMVDALLRVLPRVRGAYTPRGPRRAAGHRRPRPVRLPAARPRPAAARGPAADGEADRRPLAATTTRPTAGAWRRRRPRSTSSAPSTCATSSPARSSSSRPGRAAALRPLRRAPARRCASSSSSTSPGPTRTWRAATCTRSAAGWGCSSRASTRPRPTW